MEKLLGDVGSCKTKEGSEAEKSKEDSSQQQTLISSDTDVQAKRLKLKKRRKSTHHVQIPQIREGKPPDRVSLPDDMRHPTRSGDPPDRVSHRTTRRHKKTESELNFCIQKAQYYEDFRPERYVYAHFLLTLGKNQSFARCHPSTRRKST